MTPDERRAAIAAGAMRRQTIGDPVPAPDQRPPVVGVVVPHPLPPERLPAQDLVARCKAIPVKKHVTVVDDQIADLALAWLTGEITREQLKDGMGWNGSAIYARLSQGLKHAFRCGKLQVIR